MKYRLSIFFFFSCSILFAQIEEFKINDYTFFVKTDTVKNEYSTNNIVKTLYRVENKKETYLLKYFEYEYEGVDCNNEFWNKEKLQIKKNSLIFTTHYFQKTGIDPLPEWRKQIYNVNLKGQLSLIYDKYKFRNSTKWINL